MADEVYIVDPGGYLGESTRREIAYAESLGKPVRYLSLERLARTGDGPKSESDRAVRSSADPRTRASARRARTVTVALTRRTIACCNPAVTPEVRENGAASRSRPR